MPQGRTRCWSAAMRRRHARRWRRPTPSARVCPRAKPAISLFSTGSWRATPRPRFPRCSCILNVWPRDAVVLGTTAFTNGLIGSSGRAGQKRMLLELLDRLAPSYGDDWWFTAHHGMALSENGQRDAARPMIERSLAQNPKNPWAAHACAHLCYEEGDPEAGARIPDLMAHHLSARRRLVQPPELASRARPSRSRRRCGGGSALPRGVRP